jgi:hypothetical protein
MHHRTTSVLEQHICQLLSTAPTFWIKKRPMLLARQCHETATWRGTKTIHGTIFTLGEVSLWNCCPVLRLEQSCSERELHPSPASATPRCCAWRQRRAHRR